VVERCRHRVDCDGSSASAVLPVVEDGGRETPIQEGKMMLKRSVVFICSLLSACSAPDGAVGGAEEAGGDETLGEARAAVVPLGPSLAGPSHLMNQLGIAPVGAPDPQIVGGTPAAAGQFPWQVTFGELGDPTQLYNDQVFPHFCGGSVIAENWVATAAHCVFGTVPNSIVLKVGVRQRSLAPDSTIEIRGAKSIILHPNYTTSTSWQVGDDIALIELNEPLKFTSRVRPVALATVSAPDSGTITVSGWGRTDGYVSAQSDLLNSVQLAVRTNAVCNAQFSWGMDPVKPSMMCAGVADGTTSSCNGDSGGPVIYRASATDSWRQVGIVSWGQTYCTSYSVFTRVSTHHAWVKTQVPNLFRNGDVNRDGCVNNTDLSLVSANIGSAPPASNVLIDTNNDGTVNSIDYLQVVSNVDSSCP
jgi:secreted trypsin-like serine protease